MGHSASGKTSKELGELLKSAGQKAFRGKQVFEFIHRNGVGSYDQMATIPATLRPQLDTPLGPVYSITEHTRAVSSDGTVKIAYQTDDGHLFETVLIPMDNGTFTQCLSSQVGCAMGCRFCMTATLGFTRNLTTSEIVDQHLLARKLVPEGSIRNLVFMGMGEPLLNFESVRDGIALLQDDRGCDFSRRRITVSTCGIIPGIERMGKEMDALLAVSLNATNQALRAEIMPISRKYPLDQLMAALKKFTLKPRQRLTFEYVLLKGVNDQDSHAKELMRLLAHIPHKINLIPFNPYPGSPFDGPKEEDISRFFNYLSKRNATVTVRRSRGADIEAACGQLAGKLGPGVGD